MESKTRKHTLPHDETAGKVAQIIGRSTDLVRKVMRGERNNDDAIAVAIDYKHGKNRLVENLKRQQALYWKAQKAGRWDIVEEIEQAIDELQDAYQKAFDTTINGFEQELL